MLCSCLAVLCLSGSAFAQARIYRGSIGNSHIQVQLNFAGRNVTGTYAYDNVGEDLRLNGVLDEQGRLELTELAPKGKQKTGKFVCKKFNDAIDQECSWSRPDGSRESLATFEEQNLGTTNGWQIVPKTISNRRTGVGVSYPQIARSGALTAGDQAFNRRILAMVQKAISEFQPIDGHGAFDASYNVLLAADDLISVELSVYYDGGGAHPNNYFLSLTYDLKTGKELAFEDLFQPGADYNTAIANYLVPDIDKRAAALEQRYQTQPQPTAKREEPIISADQLTEVSGWGLTPKGLVVYFDFPHVIAAFDKNVVPYTVVKQYLKPNGPAARFQ
jgi:hypothetical protein